MPDGSRLRALRRRALARPRRRARGRGRARRRRRGSRWREALLASRRSWSRRVRDEQVDVSALGGGARARRTARRGPARRRPTAYAARPARRARGRGWRGPSRPARGATSARARARGLVGARWPSRCSSAGWAWWAALPGAAEVRQEANPLPVDLVRRGRAAPRGRRGRAAGRRRVRGRGGRAPPPRLRSGEVVRVDADGDVHGLDRRAGRRSTTPPDPPPYLPLGEYDVLVQSAPVPGRWLGAPARLLAPRRAPGRRAAVGVRAPGARGLHGGLRVRAARDHHVADGSIRLR